MDPIEHNRRAWDQRVRDGQVFARPATRKDLEQVEQRIDPWAREVGLRGRHVLCLGAGGGRQSIYYAATGASVVVVDISSLQLELDRQVAAELGLDVTPIRASIDNLSMLADRAFDMVVQPVSTAYVPDVMKVYREVARVIRPEGLYLAQHKQPASLQADLRPVDDGRRYRVAERYYRDEPLPQVTGSRHREAGTLEYLHRWEQLVGGLCRSGFVVEDLCEPYHGDPTAAAGSYQHRSLYIPPYVRIKARRKAEPTEQDPGGGPILTV